MDEIQQPESLTKYIEKTKYRVFVPFVVFNYPFRWLAYFLDKVAFLKVIEYVGILSIIVAVYFYYTGRNVRQKEKHYKAWQVISLTQGKPGEGGRIAALQDLYEDGVSLSNIDLSNATIPEVYLENANLCSANFSGADLTRANFFGANLVNANLSNANLCSANFSGADLTRANLFGAILIDANMTDATLEGANLSGANLERANFSRTSLVNTNLSRAKLWKTNLSGTYLLIANLSGASLYQTNLSGAYLLWVNLSKASFYEANLSEANLYGANLDGIKNWRNISNINKANIYNLRNAPFGFINWAKENGAVEYELIKSYEQLKPPVAIERDIKRQLQSYSTGSSRPKN